jgi:predicted ATPase
VVSLDSPITMLVGENGTGKSTLLKAIAQAAGYHLWQGLERERFSVNRYENRLGEALRVQWTAGRTPGSFFAAETFRHFRVNLDEWAANDPGLLRYFGNRSLMEQSHGQGHMAYFANRLNRRGLYLLDEPENALSPSRQIELVRLLRDAAIAGPAQCIVATHSPILLACPGARILSLDGAAIEPVAYEHTEHVRIHRAFMHDPGRFLDERQSHGAPNME